MLSGISEGIHFFFVFRLFLRKEKEKKGEAGATPTKRLRENDGALMSKVATLPKRKKIISLPFKNVGHAKCLLGNYNGQSYPRHKGF